MLKDLFKPKVIYTVLENGEGLPEPVYAKPGDSAVDLRAAFVDEKWAIPPFESALVPTGIAVELKRGFEAQVRSRSGLAAKETVFVLNSPGTIDSDYRGEIKVIIFNLGRKPFLINRGDRIAQLAICKVEQPLLLKRSELKQTERGSEGFGSTGKN